jgi:hypothetical protein
MIKEYNLVAYISKSLPVSSVTSGYVLPVFAVEGERMDQAGFKRIGTARVSVELDEAQDELDARIAAAGLGVAGGAA